MAYEAARSDQDERQQNSPVARLRSEGSADAHKHRLAKESYLAPESIDESNDRECESWTHLHCASLT